ncbi:MAG TPA: hypothetical protein VI702_02420 [Nitrospiria bacterium]
MKRFGSLMTMVLLGSLAAMPASGQMMGGPHGDEMGGGPHESEGMGGDMPMGGKMMGGAMGLDGGMMEMMKTMRAVRKLELTADQDRKIRQMHLQHQKEAVKLMGRIRIAGIESDELLMAEPVNLDKVKVKVGEKYAAAAELEMAHLSMIQQVKAVLTPDQRKALESPMAGKSPPPRPSREPMHKGMP